VKAELAETYIMFPQALFLCRHFHMFLEFWKRVNHN